MEIIVSKILKSIHKVRQNKIVIIAIITERKATILVLQFEAVLLLYKLSN